MVIRTRILRSILIVFLLLSLFPTQVSRVESSFSPDIRAEYSNVMYLPQLSYMALGSSACHFSVNVLNNQLSLLGSIGVGAMVDWGKNPPANLPSNIEHIPVVQVSDDGYASNLAIIGSAVKSHPGATWVIGNEPDSEVTYQDHISAETYAERFYEMAKVIRATDPTAKIGFGSVIQPTPVRLYYLDLAITRLSQLAGGLDQALRLIDVYTIHAFILNEVPNTWGAGVPVGYYDPKNSYPAYETINIWDQVDAAQTYDINRFSARVIAFREWMNKYGEKNKPLWITEYGSLLPSKNDPNQNFVTVPEADTAAYMAQTFDFLLGYKDRNLGNAGDDYRLVQKFSWYSLNDNLANFGGSLIDPASGMLTEVGDRFIHYTPNTNAVPVRDSDVYLVDKPLVAMDSGGSKVVYVEVANALSMDRVTPIRVSVYVNGQMVGTQAGEVPRCAGSVQIPVTVSGSAGQTYTYSATVKILDGYGKDLIPSNNSLTYPAVTLP